MARFKYYITPLLWLLCISGWAQQWKKENIEKFYTEILGQYGTPEMKHIFNERKKFPYLQWVDDEKTHNKVLFSLLTVIHEMQHSMDDFTGERDIKKHAYYLTRDCTVEVPLNGHFTTDKLNAYVPQKVADSMLRYNIYVGKKDNISTYNTKFKINNGKSTSFSIYYGIYGLLEEFLAYYRGMEVFAAIYPYFINYVNNERLTQEQKDEYLGDYKFYVLQEASSFYEFQLFVGWYLLYAKSQHPAVYDSMYANPQLRAVFSHVHHAFKNLVDTTLPLFDNIKMTNDMAFIHHLKLDGTEDDVCRFVLHSGMASEEDAHLLLEETTTAKGEKLYRFAGSKQDYQLFKKYYNEIKNEFSKNFKTVADAKLYLFLIDPEANVRALKSRATPEIIKELEKFSVGPHAYKAFCK